MRCSKCGSAGVDGGRFCGNCGHEMYGMEEGQASRPDAQYAPPRYPPPPHAPPAPLKDPNISVLLELLGGLIFQTFGVGHIYNGRVAKGLWYMFGYWALLIINAILTVFVIGICTLVVTYVLFMIFSPIRAYKDAVEINEELIRY